MNAAGASGASGNAANTAMNIDPNPVNKPAGRPILGNNNMIEFSGYQRPNIAASGVSGNAANTAMNVDTNPANKPAGRPILGNKYYLIDQFPKDPGMDAAGASGTSCNAAEIDMNVDTPPLYKQAGASVRNPRKNGVVYQPPHNARTYDAVFDFDDDSMELAMINSQALANYRFDSNSGNPRPFQQFYKRRANDDDEGDTEKKRKK